MNIIKSIKQLKPGLQLVLLISFLVMLLGLTGHFDDLGKKTGMGGLFGLSTGMLIFGILIILVVSMNYTHLTTPDAIPFLIVAIILIVLSFGGFGFVFGSSPKIPTWGWIGGFILLFFMVTSKNKERRGYY
jgi:hypothetical protein